MAAKTPVAAGTGAQLSPVQAFAEHSTVFLRGLEACLREPSGRVVHRLRTESRRVEALLAVLPRVSGAPRHPRKARALQRSLRKIRKAAGRVRDLDVQTRTLEEMGKGFELAAERVGQTPAPAAGKLAEATAALGKHLTKRRKKAARRLRDKLKLQRHRARSAVRAIRSSLRSSDQPPAADLQRGAEAKAMLTRSPLLSGPATDGLSGQELHNVRKGAKSARYLLEMVGPGNREAVQQARDFEFLQDVGGRWHDALALAKTARKFLGKGHPLAERLAVEQDEALAVYHAALRADASRPAVPSDPAPTPGQPVTTLPAE